MQEFIHKKFKQDLDKLKNALPIEQLLAVYPGAHWHEKPLIWSLQFPPFRQGLIGRHSLISTTKRKNQFRVVKEWCKKETFIAQSLNFCTSETRQASETYGADILRQEFGMLFFRAGAWSLAWRQELGVQFLKFETRYNMSLKVRDNHDTYQNLIGWSLWKLTSISSKKEKYVSFKFVSLND